MELVSPNIVGRSTCQRPATFMHYIKSWPNNQQRTTPTHWQTHTRTHIHSLRKR